ncbi:MAG: ABC transporter ATP-binding protein [Acidimicrobiia bacterium]|nr:ABC transporter ATP-binding protein [bacterium]MXX01441.1 ABC transporter ATP-binding protein [Acidimicrobiia bacterium]MYB78374.1 ABC transporter ATP-binding protein [Acidimicrobiia bacterium]
MTEEQPMIPDSAFTIDGVSTGYGKQVVSRRLSLTIERGTRTALVGPNGSGKSTTLKTLARLIEPLSGAVYLSGQDINRLPTRQVARQMAILPQVHEVPAELTVMELVEQGRFPHVGALGMLRRRDDQAIQDAIGMTRLSDFVHRPIDTLSGGERQRAWMALALSQQTDILLLDEPTTFLDVGHQLDLLELISGLNRDRGVTIVMVLHDLNHAARFSDRMIAMSGGDVVADGPPAQVLTPRLLRDCFGVEASVATDPNTGSPMCIPHSPIFSEDQENAANG